MKDKRTKLIWDEAGLSIAEYAGLTGPERIAVLHKHGREKFTEEEVDLLWKWFLDNSEGSLLRQYFFEAAEKHHIKANYPHAIFG